MMTEAIRQVALDAELSEELILANEEALYRFAGLLLQQCITFSLLEGDNQIAYLIVDHFGI
jgi:hypothetical protein